MLVLVLAFVAVFGVLISIVLAQTGTGLRRTLVTRDNDAKVYAADAGVEAGILNLRNDDSACATAGTLLSMTVNGKAVTVSCTPVSGSALGARGYALITTDGNDSLVTQSGGGGLKKIQGNVFASSIDNAADLTVERGNVLERRSGSTCSADSDQPGSLLVTPSPPFRYRCTTTSWTALDPAPALGTAPALHPLPTADATLPMPGGELCSVFRPGTYSAGIVLGQHNYFTSGVYYFPAGDIVVGAADLVAGAPASGDGLINPATACRTDAALSATSPGMQTIQGTGAKIVLGGTARLLVDTQGQVEIYTRTGGPASEGTSSVGIYRVPSSPPASTPAWAPSLVPIGTPLVQVTSGNTPDLAVHGLIYMPGAFMDFNATNTVQAQLVGGLVAGRFQFQSSASASGINISLSSGPGRRRVQLVATATDGGRDVISRAVLDVENDTNRTASVTSWLTDQG